MPLPPHGFEERSGLSGHKVVNQLNRCSKEPGARFTTRTAQPRGQLRSSRLYLRKLGKIGRCKCSLTSLTIFQIPIHYNPGSSDYFGSNLFGNKFTVSVTRSSGC